MLLCGKIEVRIFIVSVDITLPGNILWSASQPFRGQALHFSMKFTQLLIGTPRKGASQERTSVLILRKIDPGEWKEDPLVLNGGELVF